MTAILCMVALTVMGLYVAFWIVVLAVALIWDAPILSAIAAIANLLERMWE